MKDNKNNNILDKYIHGTISEDEYNRLRQQVQDDPDGHIQEMLEESWHNDLNIYPISQTTKERMRNRIHEQIKQDVRRIFIKKISTIAAAVLLPVLIFSTVYFYYEAYRYKQVPSIVCVDKGQRAGITLPDGTTVHLNGGSKISYTPAFNGSMREVELEGEAYFDVKPNKEKPFIVKTSFFNVEVLGTSFNVSAYSDDKVVEAALVEGKVKLTMNTARGNTQPVYLTPSQKFVYSHAERKGTISLMDEDYELAWKKGILMFNAESLEDVFKKIERWYGVTIHFDKANIDNDQFTGQFKDIPIQEMMNILRMHYNNMKFKIEKNDIYII